RAESVSSKERSVAGVDIARSERARFDGGQSDYTRVCESEEGVGMGGKSWGLLVLLLFAFSAVLYGLHRAPLWLASLGLLSYHNRKPEGGGSGALGVLQEIYEPSVRQVVVVKDEKRVRQREGIDVGIGEGAMRFLELTLPTIEENLALDESLLLEAEAGR